ncbi:MAG: hypothetical protein M1827_001067 [Pycnora praestabilis]|nr:MAG: hypothetical protein M1827_001067 [Pycnora praestabilis]
MSENRKLTDFFKPFAQPRVKRALPVEEADTITLRARELSGRAPNVGTVNESQALQSRKRQPLFEPTNQIRSDEVLSLEHPPASSSSELTDPPSSSLGLTGKPQSFQHISSSDNHRVIEDGQVVIKSSDTEDSDSDSSLADIDELLSTRKSAAVKVDSKFIGRSSNAHGLQRGSQRQGGSYAAFFPSPLPVMPKYKFSLDSLMARSEKDLAAEAEVYQARVRMWSPMRDTEVNQATDTSNASVARPVDDETNVDQGLLASVVQEDNEDGGLQKILHAMERTEALNREKAWYFFTNEEHHAPSERPSFLERAKSRSGWESIFSDTNTRQQAVVSGFSQEIIRFNNLHDELIIWFLHELLSESRDNLQYGYTIGLRSATSQIHNIVQPKHIEELFFKLGAPSASTDLTMVARPIPQALKARLLIDSTITNNGELLLCIEEGISSLVDGIPELEVDTALLRISESLNASAQYPPFRHQLVKYLPPFSPRLHLLRRRLALAFFFDDSSYLGSPPDLVLQLSQVMERLQGPAFDVTSDIDFTEFAATISILDIGLDNGMSVIALGEEKEAAFNHEADLLAKKIKAMFTNILDSGASHMTRTEAKEVLERLHYRLIYGIRTKQKAKKGLFSSTSGIGDNDVDARASGVMARFLSQGNK